jgi:sulfopropanediol 3-dehydrogenase
LRASSSVVACTPPVKGEGFYPPTIHAMHAAGAGSHLRGRRRAAMAMMAFGLGDIEPGRRALRRGEQVRRRGQATAVWPLWDRPSRRADGDRDHRRRLGRPVPRRLATCLGQAEHDPASGIYLICMSESFARETIAELDKQLAVLPTRDVASLSWRDNGIVHVATISTRRSD